MTFYICLGICGISLVVHSDYIRISFLFFTVGATAYNLEDVMSTMQHSQAALLLKTIVLEDLIKKKLPEDYKKIYTENIYDPIKID